MEQTLNESSNVIEALVTLTSNEDSDDSSTEAVDNKIFERSHADEEAEWRCVCMWNEVICLLFDRR